MKKHLLKTMLTALILLMGGVNGAWAETFTGTVEFVAKSRIAKNADGTFTTANNAGNGYALALADLSGLANIESATSITLDFDVTISGRLLIGIGDKSVRGENANESKQATYKTDGLMFYYGTNDGTYVRVNGGTNNSNLMGTSSHVKFTLDRQKGTYSYIITYVDGESESQTGFSASNQSTNVNGATVVEAYSWANNQLITISSVDYSYEYSAASFDYKVNAVDADNNVLKQFAAGTSSEAVFTPYPYAINVDGEWYTTAETLYGVTSTALAPETNILYTKSDDIVLFLEGESTAGTDPGYSNGTFGTVAAQNKRDRGLSAGTLAPGKYEFIAKLVADGNSGRAITIREGANDPFVSAVADNSSKTETIPFTIYKTTGNLYVNGANSGTEKTNLSTSFDYVIVKRIGDATVAAPTFTPAATTDELEEAFDLTLNCETEGADIYYTIDGTEPTAESLNYEEGTSIIHIDATTTIKAIAILGTVSSEVATSTYTFKAAEEPTGNVYYVKVTDTDDITDGDYLIVYETGGVAFNGGLEDLDAVPNTIPVEITEGKIASSDKIDAAVFTIDVTNGTIKSASGLYIGVGGNSNGLKTSNDATTFTNSFAIDGDGNAVISAIFQGSTMTLRYNTTTNQSRFRYYKNSGQEAIQLYKKVAGGEEPPTPITVATPTFDPAETTEEFEAAFDLKMSCDTKDAVIHYTLDGTEPTTESPVYDTPINIVKTTTVKAIAIYKGVSSDLATATYTFKASEVYYEKVTSTADITDGEYLIVYEEGNVAFDGGLSSLEVTNNTISIEITEGKIASSDAVDAAVVIIDPDKKSVKSTSGKYIGISSNSNAINEVDETYQHDAIEIDGSGNVIISKTFGTNNNRYLQYNDGSTCFRYYKGTQKDIQLYKKVTPAPVITVAAPTFSLVGGEYTEAQTVELSCETEGATIYYTTNGDDPTTESIQYNTEDPITVSETTTIKAIAVLNGVESEVATATYTINPPVTTVDLAITKMSVSGTYDMSSTNFLYLYHNVKNNGGIPTNDFVINYYKDDDTVPFYTIDWSSREPLGAGKTETLSINIREFFTTLGKYRLRAELVCENDITPGDNNLDGGFVTLYVRGDANVNGEVTTSDAVAAVSYALEKIKPDELQKLSADVDKTGDITVADAQAIVNIALSYEFEAAARGAEAGVNYLTMENSGIGLVNTTGFSAFQMDVTLSDGAVLNSARLTERAAGMLLMTNKVGNNTWRIAALSLDGSTISGSEGALLNLDIAGQGSVSVSNVEFADRAAHAYKLGFGTPTAIDALYNNKEDGEVYTVSGVRSNGVKKGINVVRRADGSVRKMLVK